MLEDKVNQFRTLFFLVFDVIAMLSQALNEVRCCLSPGGNLSHQSELQREIRRSICQERAGTV